MPAASSASDQSISDLNAEAASTSESTELKLFQIDCHEKTTQNYRDERGYMYTRNNSRTQTTLYMRCKNSVRYSCLARVIVKGNDFEKAVLTCKHNHFAEQKKLG